MIAIGILALLAAATTSNGSDDPLSKSDEGLVQCYEPNDVAKTCLSLASYKRNSDGTWDNTAIVLLSRNQPVTLETVTLVRVKNEAVCGYIRSEDVLRGKIRFSGQLLPDEKAAPILVKVAAGMAPLMGKEICTVYVQIQDDLIAKGKIEGGTTPVLEQRVKWIHLSDGYAVAPAATESGAKP